MWAWLEPEEWIGRQWHRWASRSASYPRHPESAVRLELIRHSLTVFFRGLGGDPGLQVAETPSGRSGHRLSLRQRLGFDDEDIAAARLDQAFLHLPESLDFLPSAALNRRHYFWLAAYFVVAAERSAIAEPDPLRRDLTLLRRARQVTATVKERFPGLARDHDALGGAFRALRPARSLPPVEAEVEAAVTALLGGPHPDPARNRCWRFVSAADCPDPSIPPAPPGYRPFLPAPMWGEVVDRGAEARGARDDQAARGQSAEGDRRRRRARRQTAGRSEDRNALTFTPTSTLFTLADMIDVARPIEDEDEDAARQALDAVDEIALSRHSRTAATRLRIELDLAPELATSGPVRGPLLYPEWDWRQGTYRKDYCAVFPGIAAEEGEAGTPDAEARRRIRTVQRQFEALRPGLQHLTRQVDGHELDLEALVRSRCDLVASGQGSDRVYAAVRRVARDLSVGLLVDVSLSTDSWVQDRRVIDVEKQALLVFAHGLNACGDDHAIFTFTSKTRAEVRVDAVKDFGEPFSARVERRISALRPGHFTRIGAAVRHLAARLALRPHRHRLLLLLTDGKPNDDDHYDGRYGVEDSRKAIQEARRSGIAVFGVTIDRQARGYFPVLFGQGAYAIIDRIERLPTALPRLYRQLVR
ncbi:MAG: VWA domain-containing protein [Azospirillum sp.]|nr:VWA domain-containing protein [Azospirillum sp.]